MFEKIMFRKKFTGPGASSKQDGSETLHLTLSVAVLWSRPFWPEP